MGGCPSCARSKRTPAAARPRAWIGPRRVEPREAIDDAEFDLAALGRTFELNPEDAKGVGHYLIGANRLPGRVPAPLCAAQP